MCVCVCVCVCVCLCLHVCMNTVGFETSCVNGSVLFMHGEEIRLLVGVALPIVH